MFRFLCLGLLVCLFNNPTYGLIKHVDPETGATWFASEHPKEHLMNNKLFGALREPAEEKAKRKTVRHVVPDNEKLPETFDARENWPQCPSIAEVRDQSACGSCWAFGAVEAMTDRLCIHSNGSFTSDVSALDLLSCCGNCGYGCEGGYPGRAWDYWMETGIVTGGSKEEPSGCRSYPFPKCTHHGHGSRPPCPHKTYDTPRCKRRCDNKTIDYDTDKTTAETSYNVLSDEKSIMKEIMKNGPVEAAFDVFEDFLKYENGIYFHKHGQLLGGHAIRLLGWGVENGTKYWLLANSWNEEWGENGYFRILRGRDECGIESDIFAGLPQARHRGL